METVIAADVMMERFHAMQASSRTMPPLDEATRRRALNSLKSCLARSEREFAAAIAKDFGARPAKETLLAEVLPSLSQIDYALGHLRGWMRPERRRTALHFWPGSSRLVHQPKGVVLIVSPWNYPLYLSVAPLVSALAAGNRVILKPSEVTPATSALLKERLTAALGPDLMAVVTGGVEVAKALCALPFDHILFTGSTAAGREVMRAAAENLTPVTLELGGKSPAIVHESFDLTLAANRIARGKLLNAGQTCIAPDYALVPEKQLDAFALRYRAAAATMVPRFANNPDYAGIVNVRHFERLRALADDASAKGATVTSIEGGNSAAGIEPKPDTRRMAPAVVTNVTDDMRIMREEIFGPLLPIVPYRDLDTAIAYVNERPRPLALYYFDTDSRRVADVLSRTVSGGATVNDTLLHIAQDGLPFGGVGPSGMGAYHGTEGFRTFSHAKPVFHQSGIAGSDLLAPPYGDAFQRVTGFLRWRFGATSKR